MKKKLGWMGIGMICLALLAGAASAQSAPQLINYQGRLANALGQPPAEGATVDLTFKFYSAATGGTLYLNPFISLTGLTYGILSFSLYSSAQLRIKKSCLRPGPLFLTSARPREASKLTIPIFLH